MYCNREQWRSQIRKEVGFAEDDFIYGFVGRITKDKGINELLSAFLNLNDDSKLLLVGNMEEEITLDQSLLFKAKQCKNIQFHENVTDIEKYYAAIDVLILPSYREGFGNVIIEAAMMGTASIVTRIPGPIDAVQEGKTALIIPCKNSEYLECAMKKIRSMDYKALGESAHRYATENFSSQKLCEKILERKEALAEL